MHRPTSPLQLPFSAVFNFRRDVHAVKQIYLNSVPVMPEFERFVSGRLSLPRVAFATFFFFPDPRDSSSVIFLDSLLLMWQPMCHHAPALRRSHFRSEHTASTAGAATFPLLYQMLLKYEHRIYMNLLAGSAARSHSNFAWTWPFTAHAI